MKIIMGDEKKLKRRVRYKFYLSSIIFDILLKSTILTILLYCILVLLNIHLTLIDIVIMFTGVVIGMFIPAKRFIDSHFDFMYDIWKQINIKELKVKMDKNEITKILEDFNIIDFF